jgi:hypothetical protein
MLIQELNQLEGQVGADHAHGQTLALPPLDDMLV